MKKKKILFIRPNSSQSKPLIKLMKKDSFFKGYKIYTKNVSSKFKTDEEANDYLNSFDVIISDVWMIRYTRKFVKTNKDLKVFELLHGAWMKNKPSAYLNPNDGGIDYIFSPNEHTSNLLKKYNSFKDEQIIKTQPPRTSYYLEYNTKKIRKYLEKLSNGYKKFALYAPTWHSLNNKVVLNVDPMMELLDSDEFLLISSHGKTKSEKILDYTWSEKYNDRVKLVESIGNNIFHKNKSVGELLMLCSDRLIADYSSIAFDYRNIFPDKKLTFYFPELDERQNDKIREVYGNAFKFWGQDTSVEIDKKNPIFPKEIDFYEVEDMKESAKIALNLLKEKLK